MIMIMMMIRSSPRSPPLLSPHPVRWTGDLVLKTSTITSLYQGITNIMMTMMIDDDDDDDIHCRQRPSSLKKSTSLVSTTSPQSYLGSGTNHNPHLATATEITRWHIQSNLSHQSNGDMFESRLDVSGLGTFPPDVEATVRYNFVKNHHCNQHHCNQYHCNQRHLQQYHCH